jgi:hypothetical protein
MTLKYKASVSTAGKEFDVDVTRKIEKTTADGVPIWRITSSQESPLFSSVDTFDLDVETLLPRQWGIKQGQANISLKYDEDSVEGAIYMGGRKMPVEVDLPAPVFGEGAALDIALTALPLADDYVTTFRQFDFQMQKARPMSLSVTGKETVTVPAGSFEVYKIELKPLDGEPGGGTVFVSEKDPRLMVRSTSQLPPQAGGGTITSELTSIE